MRRGAVFLVLAGLLLASPAVSAKAPSREAVEALLRKGQVPEQLQSMLKLLRRTLIDSPTTTKANRPAIETLLQETIDPKAVFAETVEQMRKGATRQHVKAATAFFGGPAGRFEGTLRLRLVNVERVRTMMSQTETPAKLEATGNERRGLQALVKAGELDSYLLRVAWEPTDAFLAGMGDGVVAGLKSRYTWGRRVNRQVAGVMQGYAPEVGWVAAQEALRDVPAGDRQLIVSFYGSDAGKWYVEALPDAVLFAMRTVAHELGLARAQMQAFPLTADTPKKDEPPPRQ